MYGSLQETLKIIFFNYILSKLSKKFEGNRYTFSRNNHLIEENHAVNISFTFLKLCTVLLSPLQPIIS